VRYQCVGPTIPDTHHVSFGDALQASAAVPSDCMGRRCREAVEALIVANHYLETDLEKLRAAVSKGYAPWPIAAA